MDWTKDIIDGMKDQNYSNTAEGIFSLINLIKGTAIQIKSSGLKQEIAAHALQFTFEFTKSEAMSNLIAYIVEDVYKEVE